MSKNFLYKSGLLAGPTVVLISPHFYNSDNMNQKEGNYPIVVLFCSLALLFNFKHFVAFERSDYKQSQLQSIMSTYVHRLLYTCTVILTLKQDQLYYKVFSWVLMRKKLCIFKIGRHQSVSTVFLQLSYSSNQFSNNN